MSRRAVIAIALLLAAGAVAAYLLTIGPRLPWAAPRGDHADPIVLYGNIEVRDAALSFNGSEHIDEIRVEEGDRVARGDVLATLETDRLVESIREARARRDTQRQVLRRLENGTRPQEIEQARAELRSAAARRTNAEREYERVRERADAGAASEQELDDARAAFDVEDAAVSVRREALDLAIEGPREENVAEARARLDQLDAALARLNAELADTELLAPAPAVVQSRVLEPGEYATPDRPVLTLALTERKWVRAYIPEPRLGRIAPGMQASVFSDSFPGDPVEGWIGFISPTAEFTPRTVQTTDLRTKLVYEVRVRVEDPDNRLRLGQPVTVEVDPQADRVEPRTGEPTPDTQPSDTQPPDTQQNGAP